MNITGFLLLIIIINSNGIGMDCSRKLHTSQEISSVCCAVNMKAKHENIEIGHDF